MSSSTNSDNKENQPCGLRKCPANLRQSYANKYDILPSKLKIVNAQPSTSRNTLGDIQNNPSLLANRHLNIPQIAVTRGTQYSENARVPPVIKERIRCKSSSDFKNNDVQQHPQPAVIKPPTKGLQVPTNIRNKSLSEVHEETYARSLSRDNKTVKSCKGKRISSFSTATTSVSNASTPINFIKVQHHSTEIQNKKKIVPYKVHSPIRPNLFTSANTFITENLIVKKDPKVKKRNNKENCSYVGDIYNQEYLQDIYLVMKETEPGEILSDGFLHIYNPNIKSRSAIVNWLLKIQNHLNFTESEFYVAIKLFDKILASVEVPINMYQLLGITTLWISLKFNNSYCISLSVLLSQCSGVYIEKQLLRMEQKVLKTLDFKVNFVEPTIYLNYYILKLRLENHDFVRNCAFYILDCLSLLPEFSSIKPSLMTASAINYSLCKVYKKKTNIIFKNLDLNFEEYGCVVEKISRQLIKMNDSDYLFNTPYIKYWKMNVSTLITY